jgi:hypothetical protein
MQRARLAGALDWVVALAVVAGIVVVRTGGFVERIGDIRFSIRREERLFTIAAAALVLRLILDWRRPPFGFGVASWRRWRRAGSVRWDDWAAVPAAERRRTALLAALGICAFGAVLLHDQLMHPFSVPEYGDPLFSIWRLGWTPHQLLTDPRHLFDANIFHPDPLTLTFSDSILLPALLAVPLEAIFHPVVAYNVLLLSGFVFSGWAMYLLIVRLTGSPAAAFLSGLIFGFYPYRLEHYNHLEMQMTWAMPLTLLFIHEYLARGRTRDALGASLCLLAQLYSAMYYAAFFTVCLAGLVPLLLPTARVPIRRLVPSAALAGALAALLALPLAIPYAQARSVRGEQAPHIVEAFSAEASDYLTAHERSALYGKRLPNRLGERALFPGVVPIVLSAVALLPPASLTTLAYAAGTAIAFEGSRGMNGVLYPQLYEWLPPFRSMRAIARFGMIVGFGLAVLAGFGALRLFQHLSSPGRRAALSAFAILIALDFWPSLKLFPVWRHPPPIYEAIRGDRSVVLAEFPLSNRPGDIAFNTIYMYFSRWHWSVSVNGYSGYFTSRYHELVPKLWDFPTPEGVAALRATGVTHVSMICALHAEQCRSMLEKMDADPEFTLVVSARWDGQPARLYRLRPEH